MRCQPGNAGNRGDVDDPSIALLLDRLQGLARAIEHTMHIDAPHPQPLVDLAPVATELVERIYGLKRELAASADRAGLDPVAWLDLNRKDWRESLPLDMTDDDARALIERVVRRAEKDALGAVAEAAIGRSTVTSDFGPPLAY